MLDFPRWKVISISLLLAFGVLMSLPSLFFGESHKYWPTFLPDETINLGLDLSGGSHILLEADPADVGETRLQTMEESVRAEMRRANPRINIGDISRKDGVLSFMVRDSTQVDSAREALLPLTTGAGLTGQRDWDIEVRDDTRFVVSPTSAGLENAVDNAMDTATDVIRRRIDEMGTREPTIIRQGDTRIVVQVPGLEDPEALKELLGKTAKLEFKLVDFEADPNAVTEGRPPVGSQIFPYPDNPSGLPNIAVKRLGGISGDKLTDAGQGFNPDTNEPVVNITFDSEGGSRFARLTQNNVGRPFAIILDGVVLSAPNINEPILGGSAQISGNFTVEGANQLSIALRSGALPVELQVVEERTVGPDLGADSIRKGMIAAIIGTAAVLAFMVVTYGRFGFYANFALTLNLFLILGVMAIFNATLTLPGIAGFILTVGSAVDANVLINERIREERRRGRRVVQAVEVGYKEASRAIFDANITNVIAGLLLFIFGSGPVRGFAVVLIIGIVTSVFTAVVVTRMLVALWLRRTRPQELVI
ncbi:protein translocase subunit SecD [Parasphingorhabdus cellanae]|uniref:Protein translocase subunit SecD n=1 Tax=Parasphingorhabdus cellanae TaxID=2806553 RepID=A0ABX7T2T0_9SPHN|nr:protein translocase subunit SecD [Parasphingorhabdus cellanae]QTD55866.1 protein translocase subunit SecD [Parasphingorhabdus cellanae]